MIIRGYAHTKKIIIRGNLVGAVMGTATSYWGTLSSRKSILLDERENKFEQSHIGEACNSGIHDGNPTPWFDLTMHDKNCATYVFILQGRATSHHYKHERPHTTTPSIAVCQVSVSTPLRLYIGRSNSKFSKKSTFLCETPIYRGAMKYAVTAR